MRHKTPSRNRPKVMHIVTRLDWRGSAEVVLQLGERLWEEGFEPLIVAGRTLHAQEDLAAYQRRTGTRIRLVRSLRRDVSLFHDLAALGSLYSLIRNEEPDIIHSHTSKAGILGRMAAKLAGCPAVIHQPHGHIFYGYFGGATTRAFLYAERLMGRISDRIITLTERSRQEHVTYRVGPPDKLVPIYCGIELSRFAQPSRSRLAVRRELGLPAEARVVGWVGRLVPIKGCGGFLEACAEARRSLPDVRYLVVGDGELRDPLTRQTAALGLSDVVTFTGDRSDVPDLMGALDLLVLSSHNEGLGRVLVEAMASGVPVLATSVGGVPEVVLDGETGCLVPPGRPGLMAGAIVDLLTNPEKAAAFVAQASRRVEIFGIDVMMRKVCELYREVLQGARARRNSRGGPA